MFYLTIDTWLFNYNRCISVWLSQNKGKEWIKDTLLFEKLTNVKPSILFSSGEAIIRCVNDFINLIDNLSDYDSGFKQMDSTMH